MFAQTRDEVRSHFVDVWQKMQEKAPLEPLEQLIAGVIARHPEYHQILTHSEHALNLEFGPTTAGENPFLHMSLHVAIIEQLQTNRPNGVVNAYNAMKTDPRNDEHTIEHKMMDCLSASLWQAQSRGAPPDEQAYLGCLNKLR